MKKRSPRATSSSGSAKRSSSPKSRRRSECRGTKTERKNLPNSRRSTRRRLRKVRSCLSNRRSKGKASLLFRMRTWPAGRRGRARRIETTKDPLKKISTLMAMTRPNKAKRLRRRRLKSRRRMRLRRRSRLKRNKESKDLTFKFEIIKHFAEVEVNPPGKIEEVSQKIEELEAKRKEFFEKGEKELDEQYLGDKSKASEENHESTISKQAKSSKKQFNVEEEDEENWPAIA
mmetsp:Transcript_22753/g.26133  ORF Transcript_22753/g.26133 Transcript_22753/m.26133 type:complete len:231 (-) Transcript_22753:8-700(-)